MGVAEAKIIPISEAVVGNLALLKEVETPGTRGWSKLGESNYEKSRIYANKKQKPFPNVFIGNLNLV